jgi:hypothetical protein
MKEHGVLNVNFRGFIIDSTKANFNVMRILFGNGDLKIPMKNQECTCFYHWAQSFDQHIKMFILLEFHDKHIKICHDYKNATTLTFANQNTKQFVFNGYYLVLHLKITFMN